MTNLKPGATETGSLTITNSGSLNSTLELVVTPGTDPANTFQAGAVTLTIDSVDGATVHDSFLPTNFGTTDATYDLGDLTGGSAEAITVNFTVSMAAGATDLNQGKSASVDLEFVTTQTDATDDESAASFS